MKLIKGIILVLAGLGLFCPVVRAQNESQDTTDYFNMSLEDLMNLDIVAVSKKAESSFDAPLGASVITHDEIVASGAVSVEEVFRLVPGFIVREESNGNYDIHIRGNDNIPPGNLTFFSENTNTLVMIDGRKVYNNLNGGIIWEAFPVSISDIERIEVVRGPATALYGPNAVSGVINFITRSAPDKKMSVNGQVQGGSASTLAGDFGVGTSMANDKVKVRISGNYEKRDRFDEDYYCFYTGDYCHYSDLLDYKTRMGIEENDPRFSKPTLAKERKGVNARVDYTLNKNVDFTVNAGYQSSEAQSVTMETSKTPLSIRTSDSYNWSALANVHGFQFQLSGSQGEQNAFKGSHMASKYDYQVIDGVLEYDWTINNLTIRPGVSYQRAVYDDTPFMDKPGEGYLNGEVELSNFAYYVRGDYQMNDKWRMIAALRMDHYNKPDDDYFTYQFISTYKFNQNNILRGSYSRANRGPVMIDFYANYNDRFDVPPMLIEYRGDDNMKLTTVDAFEMGYRWRISRQWQLDVEGFYSQMDNFSSFEPSINEFNPEQGMVHVRYQYQNITAKSVQTGLTTSLMFSPNSDVQVKLFGTVQHTELKDFAQKVSPLMNNFKDLVFELPEYKTVDKTHKQTPSFYGGGSVSVNPIEKLNIFGSVYCYGEQTYRHYYADYDETKGQVDIDAKAIVNLKVAYKVYKGSSVFLNARNLFNSSQREFGFADQPTNLFLVGMNIDL
ncbi:hypothetical protein DMA11_20120 [Marinilabiliaceae bacterium JC017]|nr:hypothetical protein DMA11_20120 [Marinilabiliaceae bacterium JC017]